MLIPVTHLYPSVGTFFRRRTSEIFNIESTNRKLCKYFNNLFFTHCDYNLSAHSYWTGEELLIGAAGDNATFSLKHLDIITFPQLCLLKTLPLVPRGQQRPSIIPPLCNFTCHYTGECGRIWRRSPCPVSWLRHFWELLYISGCKTNLFLPPLPVRNRSIRLSEKQRRSGVNWLGQIYLQL